MPRIAPALRLLCTRAAGACLLLVLLVGCEPDASPLTDAERERLAEDVRAVLSEQQAAWNEGDLEGFMAGYVQGDSLRFASGGNVRYGWQETLEGYQRGYPDCAAMGTLTFSDLDVDVLSPQHALVFGRWHLARQGEADADAPQGLFTLLAERQPDGTWRIAADHTSSAG